MQERISVSSLPKWPLLLKEEIFMNVQLDSREVQLRKAMKDKGLPVNIFWKYGYARSFVLHLEHTKDWTISSIIDKIMLSE